MKGNGPYNISWRLGLIGPMLVSLSYTWLPVGGLGLALLVALWLPAYAPAARPWELWLSAGLALVVYAACLLAAEAARTRLAGLFSARWPRNVHLFPFGAAFAYPPDSLPRARAIAMALMAPAVLGLLSLGFLALGVVAGSALPGLLLGVLKALALATAGAFLLNLLPGFPLAGGWVLFALFSGPGRNEGARARTGSVAARVVGALIFLALVVAAIAQARFGRNGTDALICAAVAWAVGEGWRVVSARASTRRTLQHLMAGDVMEAPAATVLPADNLAAVMWRYRKLPDSAVLAVRDERCGLVGLLPLVMADHILQGRWQSIQVSRIMLPTNLLPSVELRTPLPAVLAALARGLQAMNSRLPSDLEEIDPLAIVSIPVVDRGAVRGVISWRRVENYEETAARAGVAEAIALLSVADPRQRKLAWRGPLLVLVLAILVLSATVKENTSSVSAGALAEPSAVAEPLATPTQVSGVTFGTPFPADGAILGRGETPVRIPITSSTRLQSVTITLNGSPLPVTLTPSGGTASQVTASARAQAFLLGEYTLEVTVQVEGGATETKDWTFRVLSDAPAQGLPR